MLAAEAKERQRGGGGDRKSEDYQKSLVSNLTQAITDNNTANGKSRDAAARLFNTNAGYISYAGRLRETAPELFADVKAGAMSLDAKSFV